MRDAVSQEYSSLVKMDYDDTDVQLQLDNNRRIHNILKGDDADAIERELYGMSQNLKDPLTNNFKSILTGSDNKVTIKVGKNKRREEVKAVTYIKGETQDRIEIATYPTTKPHSVRTYSFAVGSDFGIGRQIVTGKKKEDGKGKYDARIEGLGEYTKQLQNGRDLLGSSEEAKEYLNGTEKKVDDYVHGNINSMKGIFNRLNSNEAYGKYGRKLLNSFSPKFFKDMELFIGEVEKEEAQGRAGVDRIDVYTSNIPSNDRGAQDAAEVYLHELIHSMTRFALESTSEQARRLKDQLSELVKEAMESIEAEDLYPENATQTEKDIIDKRYDYIFNNERGPDIGDQEFLAFALTNPAFIEKLKTVGVKEEQLPLMDRIIDFFQKLSRILLGELPFKDKDKNLYDRTYNLVYRLGEINNGVEEKQSKLVSASEYVTDMLTAVDRAIADKIQAAKEKVSGEGTFLESYPENGTKAEKTKYMLKFVKYGVTTEEGRNLFGLMFGSFGFDPKSSIREIVGSFFERSSTEKAVDWLGLAAGKIDTMRESEVNTSRSIIFEAFDGELKEFEDEAITKYIIDTNLGSVYKKYGLQNLKKFIGSKAEIVKELTELKKQLGKLDKKNYNWLSTQAHGLGYYMATHISNKAQNTNSYNIANGYTADLDIKYNEDIELVVSQIAALTALTYTMDTDADVILDLISRKPEGIKTVINMYEGFKTATRQTMFKDDPVHMVEGYSTEQFNENIELKILPIEDAARLSSLGFKQVKDLGRTNKEGKRLGLYVSEGYGVKERLRGAAKLVSMSAKGTSLAEVIYGNSLNPELELSVETGILDRKRLEAAREMANGSFDVTKNEDNMMPLLNGNGKVVGYRYTMDKKSKKEFLDQDTKVSEVLPRSKGHLIDKMYTLDQNENVLAFIKEDMEDNWGGLETGGPKGLTPYTIIKEDSSSEEIRELYKMLPKSFKEYISSREDKSLAVPTALYYSIFGYQHMSIVHNKWAKKFPEFAVKFAGMLEELWMDLVKVVKGNILMKMPVVLIGNIISNMMIRIVNGAEPIGLMKDYYRSFKDVRRFTKNNREILRLQGEVDIAKEELLTNPNNQLEKDIKRKEIIINRLKASNDKNEVKELVDAGLYQAIVEDVEVSTIDGKTVWDKMGNRVLGVLPTTVRGKVKTGTDILYFNQKTKWFKVNQEIMQLSDLIARDVQNRTAKAIERKQARGGADLPMWWMEEKKWDKGRRIRTKEEKTEFEDKNRDVRMYSLLENYVNYSRPSGRGEEYLNRMGILMFTKYAKRIQKVVMDQGTHYPLKTFLSVLFSNAVMDLSTIQDAHIFSKDWHMDGHGAGNFYPLYNPLGHIENFITPALIKDSTWDFLPF